MSLCVAAAGSVLALAVTGFELSWTHSVTRGWTLCAAGRCLELGAEAGPPARLWQAEDCGA